MDTTQMTDSQFVVLSLQPADKAHQPVTIDASIVPVWQAADGTVVTLQPSSDGLSCKVIASLALAVDGAKIGTSQVTATATKSDGSTVVFAKNYVVIGGDLAEFDPTETTPAEFVPTA